MKFYTPGERFYKGKKTVYENGSSQPKFFDYQVILYAYSNFFECRRCLDVQTGCSDMRPVGLERMPPWAV
jgi:hypothetical protein